MVSARNLRSKIKQHPHVQGENNMTHEHRPSQGPEHSSANQRPVNKKTPESERTIDFAPDGNAPQTDSQVVLSASSPPLPAGGSVLQALAASSHGAMPQVHLRETDDEPLTTMDQPYS